MTDTNVTLTGVHLSAKEAPWSRRGPLTVFSLIAGLTIAALWSAQLVDDHIGVNIATGMLGHDTLTTGITSTAAGIIFAFTAGPAGTLTRLKLALRPIARLSAGLTVVTGT
ncbi:MAG TPA: hypothetical protein VF070_41170 [Streptosporangiaceae bacterium]